ncbi:MAG: hypothetical protein ACF8OB_01400 [Phycisphaeraceae bacterium JB051]
MATQQEKKLRINRVLDMLTKGHTKGEIKQVCRDEFGCSYRTTERDIASAREELMREADEDRKAMLARSLSFYRAITTNDGESTLNKLRAQKRIDKIMGLEAPLKHEHSGRDGRPIQTQMIDAEKATQIAGDPELAAHAEALGVALNLPTGQIDEDDSE